MDDTSEKCARNPPHTSIQPCPYEPNGPRPPQFNPYIAPAFSIQDGSDNADSAERVGAPMDKADANEIDLDDLDVDQSANATTAESDALDASPAGESNSDDAAIESVVVKPAGSDVSLVVGEATTKPCADAPHLATSVVGGKEVVSTDAASVSTAPQEATIPSNDTCSVTQSAPVAAPEMVTTVAGEAAVNTPLPLFVPPPPCFRPPPPLPPSMHGPPLSPQPAAVFNPNWTEEDCELIPGGPLWNYLDILARHDGPVQEIYEQLGPYRFY